MVRLLGQPEPLRALERLRVEPGRGLGPDQLHLPQEDVHAGRSESRYLPQQRTQFVEIAVRLVAHTPQIAAPTLQQQLGAFTEHRRRALVVAPIAALAQRVDPLLPARVGHPARIAHPRLVQGAGGREGDGAADPRAEETGHDQGAVQRLRCVPQLDARLLGERTAVFGDKRLDDPAVPVCSAGHDYGLSGSWPSVISR